MEIIDYIKPELLIVSVVLYFFNKAIVQSKIFDHKYILLVNGVAGIFICGIYVISVGTFSTSQQFTKAAFTSITQGILVAGISTYTNKLFNINGKEEVEAEEDDPPVSIDLRCDTKQETEDQLKKEIVSEIEKDLTNGPGSNQSAQPEADKADKNVE